jgi:uncharacterized protein
MPVDYAAALDVYQRFADQGDPHAQCNLGIMYGLGLGVEQSYYKAMTWYAEAAHKGNSKAQANLGWMYGTGRATPQDYTSAYAWYSVAGAPGEDIARSNRDLLAQGMTPSQLERAQDGAKEIVRKIAANEGQLI